MVQEENCWILYIQTSHNSGVVSKLKTKSLTALHKNLNWLKMAYIHTYMCILYIETSQWIALNYTTNTYNSSILKFL